MSGPTRANRRSIRPAWSTPSSAPKRCSKTGSSILPSSNAISTSRNALVAAERLHERVGREPGLAAELAERGEQVRRQHAAPVDEQAGCAPAHSPCATAHACSASAGTPAVEQLEEGVVGRAGEQALVGALEEDRRLPQRERRVPGDVAHRAARALLVARDQLGARGEARLRRDGAAREVACRGRRAARTWR